MIRYSKWLIPNSRSNSALISGCSRRIIVDSCAQVRCSSASSHRVSRVVLTVPL
jgi:hypothetical protein